jgi:Big-like domain-containing protein
MIRRGLRLQLVAAIGIALAVPTLAFAAQNERSVATLTTLTLETHDQGGRTQATVAIAVTGEDRLPATGAVAVSDFGRQLAGAALNAQGQATLILDLLEGDHSLTAAYTGDDTHRGSRSQSFRVRAQASATPDFQISVAPVTLSLTAGQSGTAVASITPVNSSALTAPMFVTLSCSGLPDQSSCNFNPENIEILPNATVPITSSMIVQTQAQEASLLRPGSNSVALAILLPGAIGLGGLAWSMRRRLWLQRLSLLAMVALVAMLGTTACNPQYRYFNHGPPPNPATPAGTYTVDVTAQSSNGVTATTHFTTMALTVN